MFPYGNTEKEGYPIKIIIEGHPYSIGFHKTEKNPYIWLSSTLNRDGYKLTDILKKLGFSNKDRIVLRQVEKDTYELTKIK